METPSRKNEPGSGVAVVMYVFVLLLILNTPFTELPVVPLHPLEHVLVDKLLEKFVRAVVTLRSAAAAALSIPEPVPYARVRLGSVPESPDAVGTAIVRKGLAPLRLDKAPLNAPARAVNRTSPPDTVMVTSAELSANPANDARVKPEKPVRTPLVKVALPPVLTTAEMVLALAGVAKAAARAAIARNNFTFFLLIFI